MNLLNAPTRTTPADALVAWGKSQGFVMPAAIMEWAGLDGERVLNEHSNQDQFFFSKPAVLTMPDGRRGLHFFRENQGNCDLIALLDHGDNPPVYFAWIGQPPWVKWSETFADAVYAQVFDWKYHVGGSSFEGSVSYGNDLCLAELSARHPEMVSTRYVEDNDEHGALHQRRFLVPPDIHITATINAKRETGLRIMGASQEVYAVESGLLEQFSSYVVRPKFSFVRMAAGELDRNVRRNSRSCIAHVAIQKVAPAAIDRIFQLSQGKPLIERAGDLTFPPHK